jgi:hypothetical protein
VLGLLLIAGAGYTAAYLAASGKVPMGTTVGGVDIGGRRPSSAEQALRDGLASRADAPFTVVINGRAQQIRPSQVGLNIDYAASVRQVGAQRSWRPSHLFHYFTAGSTYAPVTTLDQEQLGRLLRTLDLTAGRTPTDGGVVFGRQAFTVRQPRPGFTIDQRYAGTAFWSAYLADSPSVRLRMAPVPPAIDLGTIDHFVRHFANPAMASSVELRFGSTGLHLQPTSYGDLLAARRVGNTLRPWVQAAALAQLTAGRLGGAALVAPRPATVALVGGRPQVVKARPGVTYRPRDVASALLRAIASKQRVATVKPTAVRATFTNADARKLGIRTQVSTFTVPLPSGPHGPVLGSAVSRLDGTIMKPHSTLSLRGLLGSSTPAQVDGDALATAVFNAAWLAGMKITAHATPATYDGTAPWGRDATLRHGRDLGFTDNTAHGVLVSVTRSAAPNSLTVTLWSTPMWTVTSSPGPRTNVVKAPQQVSQAPDCTASAGRDGFHVTVTRSFARGGRVDHTSSYAVSYAPVAAVVCQAPQHHHHHGHGHG